MGACVGPGFLFHTIYRRLFGAKVNQLESQVFNI